MRSILTGRVKRLLLRLQRRHPHLGVRGISDLARKQGIVLSKSSVHSVFKKRGIITHKGRKQALSAYQKKGSFNCSLFFARIAGETSGFFTYAARMLSLQKGHAENKEAPSNAKAAFLYAFASQAGIDWAVYKRISRTKGTRQDVAQCLSTAGSLDMSTFWRTYARPVALLRFTFSNGKHIVCDPKCTTLWQDCCPFPFLHTSFYEAEQCVQRICARKALVIGYTKSVEYLSDLVWNALEGVSQGLTRIDALDAEGSLVRRFPCEGIKISFAIGYKVKELAKSAVYIGKRPRFKKITTGIDDVSWAPFPVRCIRFSNKKASVIGNALLARTKKTLPAWGIIMQTREHVSAIVRAYVRRWPHSEGMFGADSVEMARFYGAPVSALPQEPARCCVAAGEYPSLGDIMGMLVSRRFGALPKACSGRLVTGKNFYKLVTRDILPQDAFWFNCQDIYLDNRRVYIEAQ